MGGRSPAPNRILLYSLRIPVPDTASMFLFEEIIVRGWELRSPRTILSSSRNKVAVGELVAWWCEEAELRSFPPKPSQKLQELSSYETASHQEGGEGKRSFAPSLHLLPAWLFHKIIPM